MIYFLGQKPHNSEKKEKSPKGGRMERERELNDY